MKAVFTEMLTLLLYTGVVIAGDRDVGVIKDLSAPCPAGSEHLIISMDDEDDRNISSVNGWTGAITRYETGTVFHFCRVDGRRFHRLDVDYAVLQLGQCPDGSWHFERFINNEDNKSNSYSVGNIWPNLVATTIWIGWPPAMDKDTQLDFCFFPHDAFATAVKMPNLGVPYGVFAPPSPRWLADGWVVTDDEDDCCSNPDSPYISQTREPASSYYDDFGNIVWNLSQIPRNYGNNSVFRTALAHTGAPECTENACEPWSTCEFSRIHVGKLPYYSFIRTRRCCKQGEWVPESDMCRDIFTLDVSLQASQRHIEREETGFDVNWVSLNVDARLAERRVGVLLVTPNLNISTGPATLNGTAEDMERLSTETHAFIAAGAGTMIRRRQYSNWTGHLDLGYRKVYNTLSYREVNFTVGVQRTLAETRVTPAVAIRLANVGTRASRDIRFIEFVGTLEVSVTPSLLFRAVAAANARQHELSVLIAYRAPIFAPIRTRRSSE